MATKLTKIRNSIVFKGCVVFLSAILFFGGTFCAEKFFAVARDHYDLHVSSMFGEGNTQYSEQLKSDLSTIVKMATLYKDDEHVKSGDAFESRKKELLKRQDKEIATKVLEEQKSFIESIYSYNETKRRYEYYDYQNVPLLKDFSSDDQVRANEENRGITVVKGKEYYKGFPLEYTDVNAEKIEKEVRKTYSKTISNEEATFRSNYISEKAKLASLVNLQYYIENTKTGQIYTNMEMVTSYKEAKKNKQTVYFSTKDEGGCSGDFVRVLDADQGDYSLNNLGDEYKVCIATPLEPKQVVKGDKYYDLAQAYLNLTQNWTIYLAVGGLLAVLWLASIVALIILAGRRDEDGNILLATIDKMSPILHLIVSTVLIGVSVFFALFLDTEIYDLSWGDPLWKFLLCASFGLLVDLLFAELVTSFARLIKSHNFWKRTLFYRFIVVNWDKVRTWFRTVFNVGDEDVRKKLLIVFVGYFVGVSLLSLFSGLGTIAIVAASVYAFTVLGRYFADLGKINEALEKAQKGNYETDLVPEEMTDAIRPIGEKVTHLTDGAKAAVEEALRNERQKTELITNVSHDLKTPLTSIITYTDLLKKCNLEDPQAQQYISVLDEKSKHLKKLVEDLVEASKASSGNVEYQLSKINLSELLEQIFGEYEEDLEKLGLDLKLNVPAAPAMVLADGQKTYRVLENLFSNVKKYAMENTRVYIDLTVDETFATVALKNISREEMNYDPSELTQRFFRGDKSRSTEGAGLGLAIAESLTTGQNGTFRISIDGDLFKVEAGFPLIKEEPKPEEPVKEAEETLA